jgi:transposase InsO family protein
MFHRWSVVCDDLGFKFKEELVKYLVYYNFQRPHQSLNYKTPAEKFEEYIRSHQGVHHVLNSNKALTPV